MEKKLEKHLEFTIIFVNSFLENKRNIKKFRDLKIKYQNSKKSIDFSLKHGIIIHVE